MIGIGSSPDVRNRLFEDFFCLVRNDQTADQAKQALVDMALEGLDRSFQDLLLAMQNEENPRLHILGTRAYFWDGSGHPVFSWIEELFLELIEHELSSYAKFLVDERFSFDPETYVEAWRILQEKLPSDASYQCVEFLARIPSACNMLSYRLPIGKAFEPAVDNLPFPNGKIPILIRTLYQKGDETSLRHMFFGRILGGDSPFSLQVKEAISDEGLLKRKERKWAKRALNLNSGGCTLV